MKEYTLEDANKEIAVSVKYVKNCLWHLDYDSAHKLPDNKDKLLQTVESLKKNVAQIEATINKLP